MPFEINNFTLGRKRFSSVGGIFNQVMHCYCSTLDTLGTIIKPDYFDLIYASRGSDWIKKGDLIAVKDATNDAQIYKITAVTPNVTIAAL